MKTCQLLAKGEDASQTLARMSSAMATQASYSVLLIAGPANPSVGPVMREYQYIDSIASVLETMDNGDMLVIRKGSEQWPLRAMAE